MGLTGQNQYHLRAKGPAGCALSGARKVSRGGGTQAGGGGVSGSRRGGHGGGGAASGESTKLIHSMSACRCSWADRALAAAGAGTCAALTRTGEDKLALGPGRKAGTGCGATCRRAAPLTDDNTAVADDAVADADADADADENAK